MSFGDGIEAGRDRRAQQSAEREDQMRNRFNLAPGDEGRDGTDAWLELDEGDPVPFEIKSSDVASVSTARDVGREHIEKWRRRHWLFGFFQRGSMNPPIARCFIYASPHQLEEWIAQQEEYAGKDWEIVRLLPTLATRDLLRAVVGDQEHYSLNDARGILKSQKLESGEHMTPQIRTLLQQAGLSGDPTKMTPAVYRALMDRQAGFSRMALGALAAELAEPLSALELTEALGDHDFYPLKDVDDLLRRRQLAAGGRLAKAAIADRADNAEGFSADRMLALLRERIRYLLDRGATRNNPHISESWLRAHVPDDQVLAGNEHRSAAWLETRVHRELQTMAAATDAPTA
jgi:hypothetical protein